MADGAAEIIGAGRGSPPPRLDQSIGDQRHLVARCVAPQCRRCAPFDPSPWLAEGGGGLPLTAFSERLRCVCGGRQAEFEIRPGAYTPPVRRDLYVFR